MAVDQAALQHIGKLMHRYFDVIVSEPLTPRLHELGERLKVQAQAAKFQNNKRPEDAPTIGLPSTRAEPA
jgi:hypothetical protein